MLEKDIVKLGLSEKEAKVYLASLELGPSPVQSIAQKSKVNRATTYVVIDSLMEMGLMSTYDEGKKTFFTAESPERLLDFLRDQKTETENKIDLLKSTMSELLSITNTNLDKPKIRYYEGIEGLKSVQDDFADSLNHGDIIYVFMPHDKFYGSYLQEKVSRNFEKRKQKNIWMKVLYTSKEGRRLDYEKEGEDNYRECLYIPYEKYPFEGGMNIYGNKIFMIDYVGKTGGIVIENKTLANTFKSIFNLIWNNYKVIMNEKKIK